MSKSIGLSLAVLLLAATPALAGNLTFENGQTAWHSTQCNKPNPPGSVINANPETPGDGLNSLVGQHNSYVDAAQAYMNCLSAEADKDQSLVNQAIAASAQKAVADMQEEVARSAQPLRARQMLAPAQKP